MGYTSANTGSPGRVPLPTPTASVESSIVIFVCLFIKASLRLQCWCQWLAGFCDRRPGLRQSTHSDLCTCLPEPACGARVTQWSARCTVTRVGCRHGDDDFLGRRPCKKKREALGLIGTQARPVASHGALNFLASHV